MDVNFDYELKPKHWIPITGIVNYIGKYKEDYDDAIKKRDQLKIIQLDKMRDFVRDRTMCLGAYNAALGLAALIGANSL